MIQAFRSLLWGRPRLIRLDKSGYLNIEFNESEF